MQYLRSTYKPHVIQCFEFWYIVKIYNGKIFHSRLSHILNLCLIPVLVSTPLSTFCHLQCSVHSLSALYFGAGGAVELALTGDSDNSSVPQNTTAAVSTGV